MLREMTNKSSYLKSVCVALAQRFQALHSDPKELLDAIKEYDFSNISDLQLRDIIELARASNGTQEIHQNLPMFFSVISETISRRLGTWRLFDPSRNLGSMTRYRKIVNSIVETAPYKSKLPFYTDDGFLDSRDFVKSFESQMVSDGLDAVDQIIVTNMIYVSEKSKYTYPGEILLPAEFYASVKLKDLEENLSFLATDEQILTGALLLEGKVVEMNAGEGKTIAAAFSALFHIIQGRSVHIITANDYLALRDTKLLEPVYEALGFSVDALLSHMTESERRYSYEANIVYGTLKEFGFDYLRDNLKFSEDEILQDELDVVIIDEADHVLIDESLTPLIISRTASKVPLGIQKIRSVVEKLVSEQKAVILSRIEVISLSTPIFNDQTNALAVVFLGDPENKILNKVFSDNPGLLRDVEVLVSSLPYIEMQKMYAQDIYFTVDLRHNLVTLTDKGHQFLELELGENFENAELEKQIKIITRSKKPSLLHRRKQIEKLKRELSRKHNRTNLVHQMLQAFILLKRNRDYIVTDSRVVLVDQLTGRMRPESQYQFGLQCALEAKERVMVQPPYQPLAEVSVEGFLNQYSHISGMTGTAPISSDEIARVYGLEVEYVSPSKPSRRIDCDPELLNSTESKWEAVLAEVRYWHQFGRPILVGTNTIEQSTELSQMFKHNGIQHNVLNAVNSRAEAEVIKASGNYGAVTISTNMAGRGTDIKLDISLDQLVIQQYIGKVKSLLSEDASKVVLNCSSVDLVEFLEIELQSKYPPPQSLERSDTSITIKGGDGQHIISLQFGLGLHVIGTEINDSKRVDDQLRGRGGRQGEFGSSKFIVSLEDRPILWSPASSFKIPRYPYHTFQRITRISVPNNVEKNLERIQDFNEQDNEIARNIAREFNRVTDVFSQSYYQFRRSIINSSRFSEICTGYLDIRSKQIVEEYFPNAPLDTYPEQFGGFADEVLLDYGIDCTYMYGKGPELIALGLRERMIEKLEVTRDLFGDQIKFAKAGKLMFLQQCDDLWSDELTHFHEQLLGALLCSYSQTTSVHDYISRCADAVNLLERQAIAGFLPSILSLTYKDLEENIESPIQFSELEAILAQ